MDNSLVCDRQWPLPTKKEAASFQCSGRANRAGTTENEEGIRWEMFNNSPRGTVGATMITMYAQKQQRPTCKGLMCLQSKAILQELEEISKGARRCLHNKSTLDIPSNRH
ncbi:hypothetical protein B0H11DRAFT_1923970 [Mycena galericulata]|nr:hypothetical protein B0H11DRAFT_1923970 [Mycena galericulata]